ncbi:MAG: interleukin-like EMT inducer domain-containing protein [Anaerolineae bacterium]
MNKKFRPHLVVISLYTLLALVFTWPLAVHFTTHVPGEATWAFDESTFLWNMWWFKYSLLNLGQTPLESNYIFFPLGIKLTTYTFNLFNAAFGLPLQLAFSLPPASNLTLLFSFISSAYGMFLLSLYLIRRPGTEDRRPERTRLFPPTPYSLLLTPYPAAFAAGAVFAFSASRMMYAALGHYNFVTIQWFPFYTLFLLKTLHRGGWKTIFLTGLFAALCLYAELTFSVFLIFLTLILWISEWRMMNGEKFTIHHSLICLFAIGFITFLLTGPFILSVLPDFLDPAYAEPGWGEGLKLSADLAGLVTLTPLHPLSDQEWLRELRAVVEGTGRFSDVNTLFLGYGILALALLGFVVCRRQGWVWLGSALIFTVLSLGPLLTLYGQNRFNLDGLEVTFPLPFALLHYIPLINANRVPNRFGIPLTMSLAVLVSFAVSSVMYHVSRITHHAPRTTHHFLLLTSYSLLLLLLLFDQYSVPLPLSDARIPDVYRQIGAEPDSFTLLQLPLGWRNSYGTLGAEQTQLQYYQSAHQRPILGGNTSRNPVFKFDYYANIPLFKALTDTELYTPADETTLQRARLQAADLMTLYNIKYLVIHDPLPYRKPYEDTFTTTRQLALDLIPHDPQPSYQSSGVQVFAAQQSDIPNPLILDFGDWSSDPYRGEGWTSNEEIFAATANWATAAEAALFFPVRGPGDRYVSIQIAPFSYPGMSGQSVVLVLNGHLLLDNFSLYEGWQVIEALLPERYLTPGLNRLTLRFAETAQPRQVLPANRLIGQTEIETPLDLEISSGSDFAFISVGFGEEKIDASAHRRGVNVAVIEPQSGQLLAVKGFDTAANTFEAAALSQFITEIPAGQIVLLASQGLEATAFFTSDTQAALQSLGLDTAALSPPFAAIGVKNAAAGAALQTNAGSAGTAYLRVGASPDTRSLAAAVDKVIISRPE